MGPSHVHHAYTSGDYYLPKVMRRMSLLTRPGSKAAEKTQNESVLTAVECMVKVGTLKKGVTFDGLEGRPLVEDDKGRPRKGLQVIPEAAAPPVAKVEKQNW